MVAAGGGGDEYCPARRESESKRRTHIVALSKYFGLVLHIYISVLSVSHGFKYFRLVLVIYLCCLSFAGVKYFRRGEVF